MAIFIPIVAGLFCSRRIKDANKKFIFYFLIFILVQSNIGNYPLYFYKYDDTGYLTGLIEGTVFQTNYWWFNITWHLISVSVFAYYYWRILNVSWHRTIIKFVVISYSISTVIYYIWNWDEFFYRKFPFVAINGGIVILFCVTFYLLELLQSERILKFYKTFNFYLTIGILLFWLVYTPLVFFEVYFRESDPQYVSLKVSVNILTVYFMYGMIALGFIVDRSNNYELSD